MSAPADHPISDAAPAAGHGQPPQALAALGARLAEARRARGLSREQLAERLHIGSEQLRALETADLAHLPEPVFVIALARRLAQTLDLDIEDALVALRRQANGDRPDRSRPAPRAPSAPAPLRPAPASPLRPAPVPLLVGLALAGLAIALGLVARQLADRGQGPRPAAAKTAAPQAPAPSPSGTAASSSESAAQPPAAPGQLLLSSREPSWIAVRDSSGTLLFEGLLSGEARYPIGAGLEVRPGRPDLVSASIGGAPARPLGPIERVTWYRFDPVPASPSSAQP